MFSPLLKFLNMKVYYCLMLLILTQCTLAQSDTKSKQIEEPKLVPFAKKMLPENVCYIVRDGGTEEPFSGKYVNNHEKGTYLCVACDHELFSSNTKYDSGSGWPSFYEPKSTDAVELLEDNTLGMKRVEVRCRACGSHLGHVFEDAPQTPTGDRYCINSVSITFEQAN